MKTKLKRSIAVAMLLFSAMLICLAYQVNVHAAGTVTSTTTLTTTATEVDTTTLYWTYSDVSTAYVTRTATFITTTTRMVQGWAETTLVEISMAITGAFPVPVTVTKTIRHPTVIPVTGESAVTTTYTTQTLTTITSTSASTATTTRVSPQTFTLALNIPIIEDNCAMYEASTVIAAMLAVALALVMVRKRIVVGISAHWKKEKVYTSTSNYVYCSKCRTENPASNKFCASCGTSLDTTLGQTPIGAPSVYPTA